MLIYSIYHFLEGLQMNKDRISNLKSEIVALLPQHAGNIKASIDSLNENMMLFLEQLLNVYDSQNRNTKFLAECYAFILKETMREQMYFAKHKDYRCHTYAEVADAVYDSPNYMEKYMIGLAISTVLWENHRKLYEFYLKFIRTKIRGGRYLEIGPGHGLFFREVLHRGICDNYTVVDISDTSLSLTKKMVDDLGIHDEVVQYLHQDFLAFEDLNKYDVIVMGEVLEHVEKPLEFLKKCKELMSDNGKCYISTCANAAAVDHIQLFNFSAEVEKLISLAGLNVNTKLVVPYRGYSIGECEQMKLPMNMAYICSK